MWVGFHDDPSFRWEGDRGATLDRVRAANATLVRAVVTWAHVAPERPAQARDPFDPAYKLDDLDEPCARAAGPRGVADDLGHAPLGQRRQGRTCRRRASPTFATSPRRSRHGTRDGTRAIRSSASGRCGTSRTCSCSSRRSSTHAAGSSALELRPALRGRVRGIKAGNPRSRVAIGETSSHGRDRRLAGKSDTIAPATFARLVAAANPRLRFDGWAHHPYPVPVGMKPTQKVRWPTSRSLRCHSSRSRSTSGSSGAAFRSGSPSTGTRRALRSQRE